MASTKLRHYFETHRIHVKTNYPVKNVLRKPEMSGRMAKWSVKLSAYDLIYEPRNAIKSQALADFVADFSSDIQNEVDLEAQQLGENLESWTLYTDGASNVRGVGLGILLKSPQGDIIPQAIRCEFPATNYEAEYEALIAGLELAKNMNIENLQVYVNSLLITNHYNGSYAVKGEKLIEYLGILKKLARYFDIFTLEQVPREDNAEADALANMGSSIRIPDGTPIPILHILYHATNPQDKEVAGIQDPGALYPEEDPKSWTVPIMRYLKEGRIPGDEKPKAFRMKVSRFTIINNI
ncbi:putative ribonuclease H [Helianthus debilis subsp. tardiflorus]